MPYCTDEDVKKLGGTYQNSSVPDTFNFDFDVLIENVGNEIDARLSMAGVSLPISSGFTKALARLKELCCLGVLAQQEDAIALSTIPTPATEGQSRGSPYRRRFEQKLEMYADNPRMTLFAGETASLSTAFTTREPIKSYSASGAIWGDKIATINEPSDFYIPFDEAF